MKRIVSLICVFGLFVSSFAQSYCLSLAKNKTTSLVFPFAVTHVDKGANSVLVQQVKGAGNVLLVKANVADFDETNLSVVTSDGSVYQFDVVYNEAYPSMTIRVMPAAIRSVTDVANALIDNPRMLRGMQDQSWEMVMDVIGIYVKDEVLFLQLEIGNNSPIDYDVDILQFTIRDRRKMKRTAVQEISLAPLHVSGNTQLIKAFTKNAVVVALDKFTIPDAKLFLIRMLEKNGGRHLQVKVKNRDLMGAKVLTTP